MNSDALSGQFLIVGALLLFFTFCAGVVYLCSCVADWKKRGK